MLAVELGSIYKPVEPLERPLIKAGHLIEDQRRTAFNNITNHRESMKLENLPSSLGFDNEIISRAGRTKTTGPVSYLCWWYFEAKQKRKLS
jgi:hypothetical protein